VIGFDGCEVMYDVAELDEVVLAYATTMHKSQGSEYPAVVIPLATQRYPMLACNLLYTGVTRGKQLAVLIGQPKACALAVRNVRAMRLLTYLAARLQPEEVTGGGKPSEHVNGPTSARIRREGPDESGAAMTCAAVGDTVPSLIFRPLREERRGQRGTQESFEPGPVCVSQIDRERGRQCFSAGVQVLYGPLDVGDGRRRAMLARFQVGR